MACGVALCPLRRQRRAGIWPPAHAWHLCPAGPPVAAQAPSEEPRALCSRLFLIGRARKFLGQPCPAPERPSSAAVSESVSAVDRFSRLQFPALDKAGPRGLSRKEISRVMKPPASLTGLLLGSPWMPAPPNPPTAPSTGPSLCRQSSDASANPAFGLFSCNSKGGPWPHGLLAVAPTPRDPFSVGRPGCGGLNSVFGDETLRAVPAPAASFPPGARLVPGRLCKAHWLWSLQGCFQDAPV